MSDDGRAPCRVALAPVLTTGGECAKTGKSRTGWRAIFHHGIRRLVITGFRRFAGCHQAAEGEKETRGQESRGQKCKELTGCWTMGTEFILLRIRPRDARFRYKPSGR